ncbi:MAG: VanW family protein, partial [Raoultibacter sp.]
DQKLFHSEATESTDSSPLVIEVGSKQVPDTMSLDEALENGVVSSIAAFTTEYTVDPVERQHNIHLVSDRLSNSIIKANGGTWSFNDIAGNCNEESGFQSAGAIVSGEFVDSVGGGICQVATTIFNSVYDTGFPVLTRHNHSLYIASYPAGRDAAVNWPDLDLVWENDSTSDALLVMSYTDTTVTATIYGVNPEYQVSTQVGEWQEGEKFKTKSTTDENLAPGSSYVKTVGADGRNITIVRSVKDKNGTLLHEDVFSSSYDPKDEVKVQGPAVEEKSASTETSAKQG